MNKMKIFTIPGTRSGFVLTLLITLLSMTAQTAWADSFTANGVWACTVIDGTTNVKIKPANRNDISGAVTIPSTVTNNATDYTVTEIESYAFDRCSGLTAITVPASVTKIGSCAFYQCSNLATYSGGDGVTVIEGDAFQHCGSLTSFTIPSGVTEIKPFTFKKSGLTSIAIPAKMTKIDQDAFEECGSLASVSIPASVTEIINNPFSGCNNLSSITVDEGNPNYKTVDNVLFSKDDKTLIAYSNKHGTTYTIPASVTIIGNGAFKGCSNLTSVTIPSGVTSIGNNAFQGCSGLTSVTIPAGVTNIEMFAFQGCSGLTSVTIPAGVTIIGNEAFNGCSNLTSVTIPASVTSIGRCAFQSCSGLTSVTIPASVTDIMSGAFGYCNSLTSVTIYAKKLNRYYNDEFNRSNPTIYVFSDCVSTYQAGWSSYTINAIPDAQLTVSGVTLNKNPGATGEYWCTYYHPAANVKINTAGIEIYKAKLNDAKDKVTLVKVDGSVIKVGQAVMLKASTSGPLSMELTSKDPEDDYSYNDLKGGSDVPAGYDAYILSAAGSPAKMGFYKFDGTLTDPVTTLDPNKAHLELPQSGPSPSRGFIGFDDDETTGISDASHLMDNGQWIMDNEAGAWYDLSGRKLAGQPTKKGIYVRDGRKVVIK